MATNKEYLKQAYDNIMSNKVTAIASKQAEILNNEVNPQIADKKRKFTEAWTAAQKELEKENQALIEAGKARGKAEVEAEYAKLEEGLLKLIGE